MRKLHLKCLFIINTFLIAQELIDCSTYSEKIVFLLKSNNPNTDVIIDNFTISALDNFPENTISNMCQVYAFSRISICSIPLNYLYKSKVYETCRKAVYSRSNQHPPTLSIYQAAKYSFFLNVLMGKNQIYHDLEYTNSYDDIDFDSHFSAHETQMRINRFCFIHSTTLDSGDNRILELVLKKMIDSGLLKILDVVWVLNYGARIDSIDISTMFKNVYFIHISDSIYKYEAPTLEIIRRFSESISKSSQFDHQILYLHTKGISYTKVYQQIEDWRELMLYFLVERHQSCYHLLASGVYDVIGVNYAAHPSRLEGNFWWSSSRYITRLPSLPSNAGKTSAEAWILSGERPRLFIPHVSQVDHYTDIYPRQNYEKLIRSSQVKTVDSSSNYNFDKDINCISLNLINSNFPE